MACCCRWRPRCQSDRPLTIFLIYDVYPIKNTAAPSHGVLLQVAATVSDMFFAHEMWDEAQSAVRQAMAAAEACGKFGLAIKLSNNLGAVLKRLDK